MNGKSLLYVNQYGQCFMASTVRELVASVGGGRVSKMYVDRAGKTLHVGYVVGGHWLTAYAPFEREA